MYASVCASEYKTSYKTPRCTFLHSWTAESYWVGNVSILVPRIAQYNLDHTLQQTIAIFFRHFMNGKFSGKERCLLVSENQWWKPWKLPKCGCFHIFSIIEKYVLSSTKLPYMIDWWWFWNKKCRGHIHFASETIYNSHSEWVRVL